MHKYILCTAILFTNLLANYVVGNQISIDDQNMEFGYCYPADSSGSTFSFAEHSGKILILDMSASW